MKKSINALRILGATAVNKANSGHPGIILGAAPMAYTLFTKHLNINPKIDKWINRDRFILSAGHGSGLLYSLLHLSGFESVSMEELKKFRQLYSLTPGHPESHITQGVDATTGPLGQGFAMGVGSAIAETYLANKFNKKTHKIFDHYTYVICGDGDLQEGVAQEAISVAGHLKLNKLIVLFDSNDIQLDSKTSLVQSENFKKKFDAANWNYILVKDGENTEEINLAIEKAKSSKKPSLIEVKTIIGRGASKEGTSAVHGAPLGNDLENVKKYYDWNHDDFEMPQEVYDDFEKNVKNRGIESYEEWVSIYKDYLNVFEKEGKILEKVLRNDFSINEIDFKELALTKPEATRNISGSILNHIQNNLSNLIGGSADLAGSTKVKGIFGDFTAKNYHGNNLPYGVREFAMGAINNGIMLHGGFKAFAAGFLVFADYMKPAMRLSSIMNLSNLYVFTHDSVAVGEDGPTHQPVEQYAMLRSQPNLNVFRPADFNETLGAYQSAFNEKHTPTALLLTRQNLPQIANSSSESAQKGAYFVRQNKDNKVTIYASGSEVSLALNAAEKLASENIETNVVSVPCWELFFKQECDYINDILGDDSFKVSLEMASTFGWERFTGKNGLNIGINTFGESAKYDDIIKHFKFDADSVVNSIKEYIE